MDYSKYWWKRQGIVSALNNTSTLDIVMSERYVHCRWVRHGANGVEAPLVVLLIPQPLSCQSIMWKGRMAQIGGKWAKSGAPATHDSRKYIHQLRADEKWDGAGTVFQSLMFQEQTSSKPSNMRYWRWQKFQHVKLKNFHTDLLPCWKRNVEKVEILSYLNSFLAGWLGELMMNWWWTDD